MMWLAAYLCFGLLLSQVLWRQRRLENAEQGVRETESLRLRLFAHALVVLLYGPLLVLVLIDFVCRFVWYGLLRNPG